MPERNFEILPYDTAVRLPSRRKRPRWSSNAPSLNVRGIECAPALVGVLYGAMCGRYVTKDQAAIERAFSIVKPWWRFEASYNVAPSQQVPVVRSAEGDREGIMLRWGLVPFFAKGVPPKYSTINARVETVETAASYRGPW